MSDLVRANLAVPQALSTYREALAAFASVERKLDSAQATYGQELEQADSKLHSDAQVVGGNDSPFDTWSHCTSQLDSAELHLRTDTNLYHATAWRAAADVLAASDVVMDLGEQVETLEEAIGRPNADTAALEPQLTQKKGEYSAARRDLSQKTDWANNLLQISPPPENSAATKCQETLDILDTCKSNYKALEKHITRIVQISEATAAFPRKFTDGAKKVSGVYEELYGSLTQRRDALRNYYYVSDVRDRAQWDFNQAVKFLNNCERTRDTTCDPGEPDTRTPCDCSSWSRAVAADLQTASAALREVEKAYAETLAFLGKQSELQAAVSASNRAITEPELNAKSGLEHERRALRDLLGKIPFYDAKQNAKVGIYLSAAVSIGTTLLSLATPVGWGTLLAFGLLGVDLGAKFYELRVALEEAKQSQEDIDRYIGKVLAAASVRTAATMALLRAYNQLVRDTVKHITNVLNILQGFRDYFNKYAQWWYAATKYVDDECEEYRCQLVCRA